MGACRYPEAGKRTPHRHEIFNQDLPSYKPLNTANQDHNPQIILHLSSFQL